MDKSWIVLLILISFASFTTGMSTYQKAFDLKNPQDLFQLRNDWQKVKGLPVIQYSEITDLETMRTGAALCTFSSMSQLGAPVWTIWGVNKEAIDPDGWLYFCAPEVKHMNIEGIGSLCEINYKMRVKLFDVDEGILICTKEII